MTVAFNYLGKLGQFGNQMFQYAATKGIASKLNTSFMIPDHREIFDDGIGNRYTILLHDVFRKKIFVLKKSSSTYLLVQMYAYGDSFKQKSILNILKSKSERTLHSKMR